MSPIPQKKVELAGAGRDQGGPAWRAAETDGMDMSLLIENLRMTPWERLQDHQRALSRVLMLQHARIKGYGKPQ